MRMRRPDGRTAVLTLLATVALAGCADEPQPKPTPVAQAPRPKIPPQDFAPGLAAPEPPPANGAQLTNDPSAPLDTPLCGSALREAAQAGSAIYDSALVSGSACTRNACFEPLTGTFIAADGSRSVCR